MSGKTAGQTDYAGSSSVEDDLEAINRSVKSLAIRMANFLGDSNKDDAEPDRYLQPIDFRFNAEILPGFPRNQALHVESYLEEITEYIDRCLAYREAWQQNTKQMLEEKVSLHLAYRLHFAALALIQAGKYSVQINISKMTSERANKAIEELKKSTDAVEMILADYLRGTGKADFMFYRVLAARVSSGPLFQKDWPGGDEDTMKQYEEKMTIEGVSKERSGDKPKLLGESALRESQYQFNQAEQSLVSNKHQILANSASLESIANSEDQRAIWLEKEQSIELKKLGMEIAATEFRLNELQRDYSVGSFHRRLDFFENRFRYDFGMALGRINFIRGALLDLCGIDVDVPQMKEFGMLDELALSLSRVVNEMSGFVHNDLNAIFPISIRSLLGKSGSDDDWVRGRERGIWEFELTRRDVFGEEKEENYGRIRLKGVSAYVVLSSGRGLYNATVRVPKVTEIYKLDQDQWKQDTLHQEYLPEVFLPRVGIREDRQPSDVAGIISLQNASPFSAQNEFWEVTLKNADFGGNLDSVGDLYIDVHLAFHAIA